MGIFWGHLVVNRSKRRQMFNYFHCHNKVVSNIIYNTVINKDILFFKDDRYVMNRFQIV